MTMARKNVRRQVALVCGLSFLLTWPAAVVFGLMTSDTTIDDFTVTGFECSTSDLVKDTKIPLAYNVVLGKLLQCYQWLLAYC